MIDPICVLHRGATSISNGVLKLVSKNRILFQVIQKNGYEKLIDGPKSSWLGHSLLPEGKNLKHTFPEEYDKEAACASFQTLQSSFLSCSQRRPYST